MKKFRFHGLLLLAIFAFLSFTSESNKAENGYYAIIVVDGVHKNNVGYSSRIIYYAGSTDCDKRRDIDFFADAKRAFSNHLKAYYTDAFPYGENNNFRTIDMPKHSTTSYLKTRAQAEQRLVEWMAEQKEKGYEVKSTNFSFSCDN